MNNTLKLGRKYKEIYTATDKADFFYLPGDIVTLAKDIELRSPSIDKRIVLPEGMQFKIIAVELNKGSDLMRYRISTLFREMMKNFKEFTSEEKVKIDEIVDQTEFHDCDFSHPPRQLMHMENYKDTIRITLVK